MQLDKRQKKIYDTAVKLFYEKGYLETTVRDIAKKMGVTAPALYSDIKSKDDIIMWICDEVGEHFGNIMADCENFVGTDEQKLCYFIKLHVEQVLQHRAVFQISWDYWRIADQKANGKYQKILYRYIDFIKNITYKVISKDQMVPFLQDDIGVLSLIQIINHVPKWAVKKDGKYDLDCISQGITHRFLHGYSK